jgi:hypothetical protein
VLENAYPLIEKSLVDKFFISTIDGDNKIIDQLSICVDVLVDIVNDPIVLADLEEHFRSLLLKISMLDGRLVKRLIYGSILLRYIIVFCC